MSDETSPIQSPTFIEVSECRFEGSDKKRTITVRRLKVGEYELSFKLFASQEEPKRLALVCDLPVNEFSQIDPVDYERVAAADLAVNQRFFGYCRRQSEWRRLVLDAPLEKLS